MPPLFTGVGVALVTLFHDDGALDAPATADLTGRLVDLGARAMLVAGTTGEPSTLAPEERSALISAVRAAIPGDVPVIVDTRSPGSSTALPEARPGLTAQIVPLVTTPLGSDSTLADRHRHDGRRPSTRPRLPRALRGRAAVALCRHL